MTAEELLAEVRGLVSLSHAEALAAWRKDPGPDTYATADKAVYAAYLNGWHFDEVDAEICRACGAA